MKKYLHGYEDLDKKPGLRLVKASPPQVQTPEDDPVHLTEIRAIAGAIETADEWERLLATARTPEERDAWENALGPHLSFKTRTCQSPGCDSGLYPVWQPVLVVKHTVLSDPIQAPLDLRYCPRCRLEMRLGDVLTLQAGQDIWNQVIAACAAAGEPIPERSLTELSFLRH